MSRSAVDILLVDDLPEKRLALRTILEQLGENLVEACSGEEALAKVLAQEFAVILLDIHMPGLDGLETAALIRGRKKSAHTPIIFITAYADERHQVKGYSLGAVDYITSPIIPEILRSKVKVLVNLYRMTQLVRQQADERVALAREQAARLAAEEATRRSTFLAEAGLVLADSLDFEARLQGLLKHVVPQLADCAGVTLLDGPGQAMRTEVAWWHPASQAVRLAPLESAAPEDDLLLSAVQRVLTSGSVESLQNLELPFPPEDTGFLDDARVLLRSALVLPLRARGRTLGVLVLAQGQSNRSFDPSTRALAEDLANRASVAIDNARLYRDVQEADRRKNEFLAMLAHELRNPLAPIRNAVEYLRLRGPQFPEIKTLRDMLDRQVQQLVRLVDDLLDISRITRDKIQLHPERVDAAEVVARAVETSRPYLDSRRHQLMVNLPPVPLRILVDPIRLTQVLGNLLHNAAKYTPEGGRIVVTVERDKSEVVFRVADNGMGIPADMLTSVFDLFTQVDCSVERSQGGLGVGLALVRRLVEMHGGRVKALSGGAGQGSEFMVRLPALPEETQATSHAAADAGSRDGRPTCRVLVVDDNQDAASSLALLLRLSGHDVRICHDGLAVMAAVEEFQPAAVLLDIGLTGLNGYQVARLLRDRQPGPPPLLIALTGYGRKADSPCSPDLLFDHYLVKPADMKLLGRVLEACAAQAIGPTESSLAQVTETCR
jgi:signal transduction histidine kinase/DNA-binding response OmpR family regulator